MAAHARSFIDDACEGELTLAPFVHGGREANTVMVGDERVPVVMCGDNYQLPPAMSGTAVSGTQWVGSNSISGIDCDFCEFRSQFHH
jgi:hypothetical protein